MDLSSQNLFQEAAPGDFGGIARLMNSVFGENPRLGSALRQWRRFDEASLLTAKDGGEVVGIGVGRVLGPRQLEQFRPFGEGVEALLRGHRVGHIVSMAVAPSHRRRGLATRLAAEILRGLAARESTLLTGVLWSHGSKANSRGLFESFGFKPLAVSDDYMGQLARLNGHQCAVCGPHCVCPSVFYAVRTEDVVARLHELGVKGA